MKRENRILRILMIIGTILFMITAFDSSRILTYLAIIPVLFAPMILPKTKYQLNDKELFQYYLFIFFADFIGCVGNLYNLTSWYDIFIHFYSGVFSFQVGQFLLNRMNEKQASISFQMLFCLSVVMLIASVWEFFEFTMDLILNMDLQHQLDTGVADTMQDMLATFFGGISAPILYHLKRKFGKKQNL